MANIFSFRFFLNANEINKEELGPRDLSDSSYSQHDKGKPCRTCTDFKTWIKQNSRTSTSSEQNSVKKVEALHEPNKHDCPVDKDELGRNTWSFLHTMAAKYPDKPTDEQQTHMKEFVRAFSEFYPCEVCAYDFRIKIKKEPVQADSQANLAQWFCRMHNHVNKKLGKPLFDCSKVDERWRDGWKDGSCG